MNRKPIGELPVLLRAVLMRGALLAAVWWVVSEGSTIVAWPYAVVVVGAATAVSIRVMPPVRGRRLHPLRLTQFLGWFLWESLRGATDVAVRALAPRMPLDPGVVEYPLRIRDSLAAAVALADVVSLLPGTLAVSVTTDRLTVHVLDRRRPVLDDIADVESRIAVALGIDLSDSTSPSP
jgi:multicomponent Na+:H+ antiporter subunit E